MTLQEKYTGKTCTLDGHAAKITGRVNQFATITPLNPKLGIVEFSWQAVERIMSKDGKFKS